MCVCVQAHCSGVGEQKIQVFPKGLTQREMQTASSRIWTQIADSIFYDDNNYC